MVLFALTEGGSCNAARNFNRYMKYGKSNNCRNGKGGVWANDVYRIARRRGMSGFKIFIVYLKHSSLSSSTLVV